MKGNIKLKGKYRFIKRNSITGEIISVSPWIENLIMKDNLLGINLILRRIGNDPVYDCKVTSGEIGTGNTAPTDSDTDLDTPVTTGILVADAIFTDDTVTLSLFIPDIDLPNGTYKEFLLRCGAQAFARSIITPNYVKGTNEDSTVEYVITGDNA